MLVTTAQQSKPGTVNLQLSFIELLGFIVLLIFLGWIIRRLLGIRHGRWGLTIGSVVLALLASLIVLGPIAIRQGSNDVIVLLVYPMTVVFGMAIAVLFMLFAGPAKPRRARRIPRPIKRTKRLFGRVARSLQITRIALKNGIFAPDPEEEEEEVAGRRTARALRATFEEAGGMFVKLGQAMAAQPQLVGPAIASELGRLHEAAAPSDLKAARAVLEEDLGPIEEVFSEFEEEPIGAASIGQTYLAWLKDGREVVVKVQRPGVRESVERDLDILTRLARRLERRTVWASGLGLSELVAGFSERTREELDLRIEASNMAAAAEPFAASGVHVPGVVDELVSPRVLVQERAAGRSLATPLVLAELSGEVRTELADHFLGAQVRQMIDGGIFHGDPHPGNVFLSGEGTLVLIDWGAVGKLDPFERSGLIDMLRALESQDPSLMRDAALSIGSAKGIIDEDALERNLARLLARGLRPDGSISPEMFAEALVVFRDFGIALPRSTTTLFRTLVTMLGTLEALAPGYSLADGAKRVGGRLMSERMVPANLQELIFNEALAQAGSIRQLPRHVDATLRSLSRGQLRIGVSVLSEPEDVEVASRFLHRLVLALVGPIFAIACVLLMTTAAGPAITPRFTFLNLIGDVGFFLSAVVVLRLIVDAQRSR